MRWKKFIRKKPKKDGWYYCTLDTGRSVRFTRVLYWNSKEDSFYLYLGSEVDYTFKPSSNSPHFVVTTDVVAWAEIPKPYSRKK